MSVSASLSPLSKPVPHARIPKTISSGQQFGTAHAKQASGVRFSSLQEIVNIPIEVWQANWDMLSVLWSEPGTAPKFIASVVTGLEASVAGFCAYLGYNKYQRVKHKQAAKRAINEIKQTASPSERAVKTMAALKYPNYRVREWAIGQISSLPVSDSDKIRGYMLALEDRDLDNFELGQNQARNFALNAMQQHSHPKYELLKDLVDSSPSVYARDNSYVVNGVYVENKSYHRTEYSDLYRKLKRQLAQQL